MSRNFEKAMVGDSPGNVPPVLRRKSNHVFDGAGENIQYHSDSESMGSKGKRYINPAICIETVEASQSLTSLQTETSCVDQHTPHPHSDCRSNSTPMLSGRESHTSGSFTKRVSCRLSGTAIDVDDDLTSRNELTYRAIAYDENTYREGSETFRLSVASLSTTNTSKEERERNNRKKEEAFKQWLAKKEQEKREKERQKKMKTKAAREPTPEEREESFRRWLQRKRHENEQRKADEIMRRYREHERLEADRLQRQRNKEAKLNEWIRKKEEEMKLMKTKEERRAARTAIEEQRRRSLGEQAYQDWLRASKKKPLPVPLNQGELSMRGSVSQMYINPIPWQSTT